MSRAPILAALAFALIPALIPTPAGAQGTDDSRPASVRVGQSSLGALYTDARAHTLYAMDMRTLRSRYGAGTDYCKGPCAETWIAFAAPKNAEPAGQWTVVSGAMGPQWAWNGNPVFTYAADKDAGSIAGNNHEDMWSVIAYVPPPPKIVAPAAIHPVYADGGYMLANGDGSLLFTRSEAASCTEDCGRWTPLNAGLASQPIGQWQLSRDGDRPRWLFRGQAVYVARGKDRADLPGGTAPLRP